MRRGNVGGGRAGGRYDAEEGTHGEKPEDKDIPSAASLTVVAARECRSWCPKGEANLSNDVTGTRPV